MSYTERRWMLRNPVLWFVMPLVLATLFVAAAEPGAWPVLFVPSFLMVLLAFGNLGIRVEGDHLHLRYFPIWRRTIALADIEAVQVVAYDWKKFGGWGIRLGRDGSIAYSVWEKQAVRITLKNGKRAVHIGTMQPRELARALKPSG